MGKLQYHPYLGILGFVDQSDEFRISRLSLTQRHRADAESFESACVKYRRSLCERESQLQIGNADYHDTVSHNLYKSYSCFAFGHTDSVILTLSDLFDPLFILSQESEINFEQLSLAFCPKIDKLDLPQNHKRWFEEPHEFIEAHQQTAKSTGINYLPVSLTPLLLISRMKLAGVAKLTGGGDISPAVIRAIAAAIDETLDKICQHSDRPEVQLCYPSAQKWRDNKGHLPFRCTVFESQGVAEITLVMRCNNYAVATLVLHHLRALTISDLIRSDDSVFGSIETFPRFARAQIIAAKGLDVGPSPTIRENHVFATTYTTACVDLAAARQQIEGNVSVDVNWVVSPGHLQEAHEIQKTLSSFQTNASAATETHYHVRFGKFDLEYRIGASALPVLPVAEFLKLADQLCEVNGELGRETGILDMSCVMSVPIPISVANQEVGPEHFPLAHIHSIISQGNGREYVGSLKTIADSHRWYRRCDLDSNLRKIGIPRRLRDSIVYLFTNFLVCLNDPKLFDSILDLYDTFRATYHLFETAAFSEYKVDPADLSDIESHATALEDACFYRLCLASPQHEMNDLAVHFRGGLNSVLNGVDVFLKVGAGIVRWICGNDPGNGVLFPYSTSYRFGAVTELCFAMQPRCKPSSFGQRHRYALAHLKLNLGHVFHVNEAVHYLHEMGHVLQDLKRTEECEVRKMVSLFREQMGDMQDPKKIDEFLECGLVWRREIFAEAFVYCFVCAFDERLFLTQFLTGHSSQPERYPNSERSEKAALLEERLLVAFFSIKLFDEQWGTIECKEEWEDFVRNCFEEFETVARPLVVAHKYAESVFIDEVATSVFWSGLRNSVTDIGYTLGKSLGGEIVQIGRDFHRYHSNLLTQVKPADERKQLCKHLLDIDHAVNEIVLTGTAVDTKQILQQFCNVGEGADCLLLVSCSMVRCYLRFCLGEIIRSSGALTELQFHVIRDCQGRIQPNSSGGIPARFMIDQGFAGYIAIRAEDRRSAILYAVAIHKTLQSFSNELRLRRLMKMLEPTN